MAAVITSVHTILKYSISIITENEVDSVCYVRWLPVSSFKPGHSLLIYFINKAFLLTFFHQFLKYCCHINCITAWTSRSLLPASWNHFGLVTNFFSFFFFYQTWRTVWRGAADHHQIPVDSQQAPTSHVWL